MDIGDLLEGLDGPQRNAVMIDAGPLAIIAPAGSGKTRVLTRRIARRIMDESAQGSHVLVLTFTKRAARELRSRLEQLTFREQVTAGTFHAVALGSLQRYWEDRNRRALTLVERPAQMLEELVATNSRWRRINPHGLAGDISWAQAQCVSPESFLETVQSDHRRCSAPPEVVGEVFGAYQALKAKRRLIDFGDLLTITTELLRNDRQFADVERWKYRHLFVDEFQDLNPAQHRLLEAWRNGRSDLCVVGDPNQAIYSWNGADPGFLHRFAELHRPATVVQLATNYRTPASVVEAAARVLGPEVIAPEAFRETGDEPTVTSYADETAEALGIASILRSEHVPQMPWSAMAVLARTNAQLQLLARVLEAHRIPHRIRRDEPEPIEAARWWAQRRRRTITEVMAELGWLPEQNDEDLDDELEALLDNGDTDDTPVEATTIDIRDDRMNRGSGPHARRARRAQLRRAAGGDEVRELAETFMSRQRDAQVDAFLPWLASVVTDELNGDSVDLVTFHAAKGLEWPVVIVAGVEDGLVPLTGTFGASRDEERRLLYVAMTRTRRRLHLTWALSRNDQRRSRTPWLDGLGRPIELVAPPPQLLHTVHHEGHSDLEGEAAITATISGALEQWRRDTARAGRADPRAVLDDATLARIAQTRPTSVADVNAIIGPVKGSRFAGPILAVIGSAHGGSNRR
ncbi:MAG: ATP-dependent helicase [Acidimicrobiia bacterium]